MKIGVFDSGVGGISLANAINNALPEHEILLREDKENLPYGTKSPKALLELATPIIREMVSEGCRVIVIACNTVTTNIIQDLRKTTTIPLVAIEPMVKPATEQTKSNIIAVCATPATLASKRYAELKQQYTRGIRVLEPDCSDWAQMIERNQVDHDMISDRISEVLSEGADVIVLACTHYHWIKEEISKLAGNKAEVMQPEEAIIRQLKQVVARLT